MYDIQVIIGPTAIGKSQLAMELAQDLKGEIISADAIQVYRYMDIGSAKPSKQDQATIPHHLIDIRTPDQGYSVANFIDDTNSCIQTLRQRNTSIIICGGTPLYVRAFLHNYQFAPQSDEADAIRATLTKRLETEGIESLVNELNDKAPHRLESLDTKNPRRVQRALEQELLGISESDSQAHSPTPRTDCTITGLETERDTLYDRINKRVDDMIQMGFIEEVESLLAKYPKSSPAFSALGYKECIQYLDGSIGKTEMIELTKQKTRNFAKRQLTWFRKFTHVNWIKVH